MKTVNIQTKQTSIDSFKKTLTVTFSQKKIEIKQNMRRLEQLKMLTKYMILKDNIFFLAMWIIFLFNYFGWFTTGEWWLKNRKKH